MGYRRHKGKLDLRRASLSRLEAKFAEAEERVRSLESDRANALAAARTGSVKLRELNARFEIVESTLARLRIARAPKRGLLGSLLGLKELPDAVKAQIAALESELQQLRSDKWDLERVVASVETYTHPIERARLWLEKVQFHTDRVRSKRDAQIELRAAAAAVAKETRKVGATVKRKLARQPWCPYCGGSLGEGPHVDHVYPVSKGGRSVPRNMVYVCAKCNSMKSNLTLAGFIAKYDLDRDGIEARLGELRKEF